MSKTECHHIFHHPTTEKEWDDVCKALDYARSVGDSAGTMLCLAQLTGECDAGYSSRQVRRCPSD